VTWTEGAGDGKGGQLHNNSIKKLLEDLRERRGGISCEWAVGDALNESNGPANSRNACKRIKAGGSDEGGRARRKKGQSVFSFKERLRFECAENRPHRTAKEGKAPVRFHPGRTKGRGEGN